MLKTVGEGAENAFLEALATGVGMDHGFALRGRERRVVDAQYVHFNPCRHQRHVRTQVVRYARRGVQGNG